LRGARKAAGRLAISGIGFSVAYFFDADHGQARRQQAMDLIARVTHRNDVVEESGGWANRPRFVPSAQSGVPFRRPVHAVHSAP
jgi:hypothetical protein